MGKPWLKLWTETLYDRKLRRIPPEQRWCWVGLLMIAAEGPDDGRLMATSSEPMTDEDFVDALKVEAETWRVARAYFVSAGMLSEDGATLTLTNYAKRQEPHDPTAARRMRNWRERNKTVTDTTVTRNVTGDVTQKLRVESEAELRIDDDDSALISPDSLKVAPETPEEAPATPPAEPATRNADYGLARRLYEEKLGGTLTPYVAEQIEALLDDCAESMRPFDWFGLALDVTLKTDAARIAAGKEGIDAKWPYAQTVLQNAIKTGRPPEYKEPTAPYKKGRHNGPNGASRRFASPVSVRTPTTPDGRYDADGIWQAH